MSISNRKPRREEGSAGGAAEALHRGLHARRRAQRQDLEVTFASDRPALMGDKARLPEPPRR